MRRQRSIAWPVVALQLLGATACTRGPHARVVESRADVGSIGVVRFPAPWTRGPSNTHILGPANYVLRAASPEELLFRRDGRGQGTSDNIFAVRIRDRFPVRTAGEDEWSRAEPLPAFRQEVPSVTGPPASATMVGYGGGAFPRRGEYWGVVLPSPDGRWLSVVSFDGRIETPWYRLCLFGCPDKPLDGDLFIDVFEVTSGTAVQSIRAHYSGMTAAVIYDEAFWGDGGRLFVMPLDERGPHTCLLAVLPGG
jgi:hypothetical protein